jgi:hypothetical protein
MDRAGAPRRDSGRGLRRGRRVAGDGRHAGRRVGESRYRRPDGGPRRYPRRNGRPGTRASSNGGSRRPRTDHQAGSARHRPRGDAAVLGCRGLRRGGLGRPSRLGRGRRRRGSSRRSGDRSGWRRRRGRLRRGSRGRGRSRARDRGRRVAARAHGQESERIEVALLVRGRADPEVDVRRRLLRVAARPDRADDVPLGHGRPLRDGQRAEMGQGHVETAVGRDRRAQARARDGAGEGHRARGRRAHRPGG